MEAIDCYTKKVLVEEGRSTPYLNLIWQLLMRHADLYYNSKLSSAPLYVYSM